jgi:hypothetical protein
MMNITEVVEDCSDPNCALLQANQFLFQQYDSAKEQLKQSIKDYPFIICNLFKGM